MTNQSLIGCYVATAKGLEMIKRQYFISVKLQQDNGVIRALYELFYHKSMFAKPSTAFDIALTRLAKKCDVDKQKLTVVAFNRC